MVQIEWKHRRMQNFNQNIQWKCAITIIIIQLPQIIHFLNFHWMTFRSSLWHLLNVCYFNIWICLFGKMNNAGTVKTNTNERWKRTSKIRSKILLLYLHAFCIVDCQNCSFTRYESYFFFQNWSIFPFCFEKFLKNLIHICIRFKNSNWIMVYGIDSGQFDTPFLICVIYLKHTYLTIDFIKCTYFNQLKYAFVFCFKKKRIEVCMNSFFWFSTSKYFDKWFEFFIILYSKIQKKFCMNATWGSCGMVLRFT